MAQDAVQVAPDVYRVLFENDRVRLLEVRLRAGAGSAPHTHPDYLVYCLQGGSVSLTGGGETAEVELGAGDVMWRPAEEHSAEGRGDQEFAALMFELK